MRRALVTGGCGFVGSAIVREVLERGAAVRVLALPGEREENLSGLDVEIVRGNVLDPDDARRAVAGVDTVFHAAAVYKSWMVDPTPMYEVNLRGTFNVLEAARRANVERVVYTASIASIGRPPVGALGDEETPYEAWDLDFAYSRSKYHSRVLAEDFARWGLDVRVVCPGIVFGPRDVAPTPSGKLILTTIALRSGVYTDGGGSYVDVRDVGRVHVLAAERGRAGQRYVATAENLTNRQFLERVASAAGLKLRFLKVPYPVARAAIRAADFRARKTGIEPPIAAEMFEYSHRPAFYSNQKARSELGATFRPFDETMADAVAYFRGKGLLRTR